jgi:3-hydroxyisobutyrate dehydrogenase-like beta-hydroxyacid dehydrogenase
VVLGFIGLGNMGNPMCRNLLKAKHKVLVFDISKSSIEACTAAGATAAQSVKDLAANANVIFVSLPTPAHVEQVALGVGGIADNAPPGTVVIDLSTNSPETVKKIAEQLGARKISLIEAPVTGGVSKAIDGTLVIMAGGDAGVVEQQRSLLAGISAQVVHVGPAGAASVAKLVNNMLLLCNTAAAVEGLMIGAKAGINLDILSEIVSGGSGNSTAFNAVSRRVLKGSFTPSFALDLAYKDMKLAVDLTEQLGVPTLMAAQTLSLMRMARSLGFGSEDFTAVAKVYEKILGVEARSNK